ncbi:MAG: hypothetical protein IAE92_06905 [Burkholderiaceae bacterium]|nr:hypothetical protein [Burkholderiaceae bacterium]
MNESVESLREALLQLRQQRALGALSDHDYQQASASLERQLLECVLASSSGVGGATGTPPDVAIGGPPDADHQRAADVKPQAKRLSNTGLAVLIAAVFVMAAAGYAWKGAPAMLGAGPGAAAISAEAPGAPSHATGGGTMEVATERLANRLQQQPDDVGGWALLARSYTVLGRHADALQAWQRALALQPGDAELRAGYADALALGGGTSAGQVPAGKTPAGVSVSGTVSLAPALAALAAPQDTVFVVARAADGRGMPLALQRAQVKDLPLAFMLDDRSAMAPQARLSGAQTVVVTARVSKSGNAMPQPGDLVGTSGPVAVGASDLRVEIRDPVAAAAGSAPVQR